MTNKVLSRFARRVLTGFPGSFAGEEAVGNPVRAEIAALPAPADRLVGRTGPVCVLVLGGSQGARVESGGADSAGRTRSSGCRGSPSVRRKAARRSRGGVCTGQRQRQRRTLYRRHGCGLCVGRSGGVPCRGFHACRAVRRRCRQRAGAVCRRRGRPSNPQCRISGWGRRRRAAQAGRQPGSALAAGVADVAHRPGPSPVDGQRRTHPGQAGRRRAHRRHHSSGGRDWGSPASGCRRASGIRDW